MEIQEYFSYRNDQLEDAKDEDGFITETAFLELVLPSLADAKLIESDDYTDCYFHLRQANLKINGYRINESGERLQLFLVNEDSISLEATQEQLLISQKNYYENQFSKTTRFISKSIRKQLDDEIQDSSSVKSLINFISSPSMGLAQIDVIEIFLISATATVDKRGATLQAKSIEFDEEKISVTAVNSRKSDTKEIVVYKRLIDLNFLYNVLISQGNRELLEVNFEKLFGKSVPALQAAQEDQFESFLCVLPGNHLAELYKRYSTRMLEKNVRSFLQFKGKNVNQGIKNTIRNNPAHFIAYNNGLTITAVGASLERKGDQTFITSLTDFQIVNGGQTTASIYFSKKDGLDISKIKVMAKINVVKNAEEEILEDLITNISLYSNAQSKVSSADLRSRNTKLVKLKSISEGVITPFGKKWFFERFKGEFNTLLKKNQNAKARINNEFPKERRFTKEELAKYFMSWGDQPYLVKKGGDKVFADFINRIDPKLEKGKEVDEGPVIDRDFYEDAIARIIIFKELVKIYGDGKSSMGQLRSAVVPYTVSVLYKYTTGSMSEDAFDLLKIWQRQGLADELKELLKSLMELVNLLIKKYSPSDDYGEYSKRKDLWDDISASREIKAFTSDSEFKRVIAKYSLSKKDVRSRWLQNRKSPGIDFSNLQENVRILSAGADYYVQLKQLMVTKLDKEAIQLIDQLITCINSKTPMSSGICEFEKDLIQQIRVKEPEIFDLIDCSDEPGWQRALDLILSLYYRAVDDGSDILHTFLRERAIAIAKGGRYLTVFDDIGATLQAGKLVTVQQLYNFANSLEMFDRLGRISLDSSEVLTNEVNG